MISRRDFLKISALMGASTYFTTSRLGSFARAFAAAQITGLSDPAAQPKFVNAVPNAADPAFSFNGKKNKYTIEIGPSVQQTGLIDPVTMTPLNTPVFGYGEKGIYTWPGKTIFAQSGEPVEVKWKNKLLDPVTGDGKRFRFV